MDDVVIRAEGLGKKYVIGHETNERYTAFRDVLAQQGRRLLRSARDMAAGRALVAGDEREEFWALKDVNFEIKRGEVVGIIGRNGAGKSTLLKVLSRITDPTEGRVIIKGRVASLLEVGTGFHPELTGRENIYLNGAILGMSRAEIKRKFDEIVDFANVEKFLDTPVKRYSSGMYVRLAFSVAAHLEPEILVVDEVLAVGDTEFQKKCLGKMRTVANDGRTVILISHNMAAISGLCSKAILLQAGRLDLSGSVNSVMQKYLEASSHIQTRVNFDPHEAEIKYATLEVVVNPDINLTIEVFATRNFQCTLEIKLSDIHGSVVAMAERGATKQSEIVTLKAGLNQITAVLSNYHFLSGVYQITASFTIPFQKGFAYTKNPATIEVIETLPGERKFEKSSSWGSILLPFARYDVEHSDA